MNAIKIIHAVPLSESILLLVNAVAAVKARTLMKQYSHSSIVSEEIFTSE